MTLCKFSLQFALSLLTNAVILSGFAQNFAVFPQKINNSDTFKIEISALPGNINTRFSEYCGTVLPDSSLYFTSMRNNASEDSENFFETNWYCYIYKSKLLNNSSLEKYDKPIPLHPRINNPKYFNSNFCFSEDGKTMIFSRCERFGEGGLKCSLWKSELKKDTWNKPKMLPEVINVDGYSSLQPNIVHFPQFDVLYFVSDRPGGYGSFDIWYSIINDDEFQSPINAGPLINTEGNEVTPFYDRHTGTLFFSTDERKGIGDFDIWCSRGSLSAWQNAEILPQPFNSEYSDIYFRINPDGNSAYLSSNRLYYNMVEDTCCNDIYLARWKKIEQKRTPADTTPSIKEKIASVLPITLYFQNDSPDPRSQSDTTKADYLQLYNSYISEIQKYIRMSGDGLEGDEQREAMYAVAAFMRDSVQTGYNRLTLLANYLKEAMENGDTISLKIEGYASPLHNSQYNKHLSKRRIVSLVNFLRKTDNSILLPYINGEKPGITIEVSPEGAVGPAFSTEEIRETVFGLRAAKERKIVIRGS